MTRTQEIERLRQRIDAQQNRHGKVSDLRRQLRDLVTEQLKTECSFWARLREMFS